jgi:hypothetical protein
MLDPMIIINLEAKSIDVLSRSAGIFWGNAIFDLTAHSSNGYLVCLVCLVVIFVVFLCIFSIFITLKWSIYVL